MEIKNFEEFVNEGVVLGKLSEGDIVTDHDENKYTVLKVNKHGTKGGTVKVEDSDGNKKTIPSEDIARKLS